MQSKRELPLGVHPPLWQLLQYKLAMKTVRTARRNLLQHNISMQENLHDYAYSRHFRRRTRMNFVVPRWFQDCLSAGFSPFRYMHPLEVLILLQNNLFMTPSTFYMPFWNEPLVHVQPVIFPFTFQMSDLMVSNFNLFKY